MRIIEHGRLRTYPILLTEAREFRNENAGQIRNILLLLLLSSSSSSSFSSSSSSTLVPGAIYGGSEERSESPLVESVGNLTSMLSQVQKLNHDDDWLDEYVSQSSSRFNFCTWLSMEVKFPTDSTRGDSLRSSLPL